MLMFAPLFLGMGLEHTMGFEYLAAAPVEHPQSEKSQNSLSEIMEELNKEDDIHTYYFSYLPQADQNTKNLFYSGPQARIVVPVPTPPPDTE